MRGTTTKLSMLFQVLGVMVTLERNNIGLAVTIINIKKVQKQESKSIKSFEMACQKSMQIM